MIRISRTKVKARVKNKTNPLLTETLVLALKHAPWFKVAHLISGSTRNYASVNLNEIEKHTKAGDTIIVVGKVLSLGELTKKVRICALSISQSARDKLKATKSEFVTIIEEIRKNPKAEGIKLIR